MRIAGRYSHKGGEEFLRKHHAEALADVESVIGLIDAEACRLKKPRQKEVRRADRAGITHFFSPSHLNALFDWRFFEGGWDLKPLLYDIATKMIIFGKLGVIECGIEICPMASMLPQMSSGIGPFEQVVWDLKARGVADIDIPVLVLGVEPQGCQVTIRNGHR